MKSGKGRGRPRKSSSELKGPRQTPKKKARKEPQEPSRKSSRKSTKVYDNLNDDKVVNIFML